MSRPTLDDLREESEPGVIERERLERDAPAMAARVRELESVVQTQGTMLHEIAQAAGYRLGEAYTARALIARLRDGDR